MKASPTVLARPAWYDRNPTSIQKLHADAGRSPHSETERWTYTVPSGKKALIESLYIKIMRATAASSAVLVLAAVQLGLGGGTNYYHWIAALRTNNVGDKDDIIIGQSIILNAGDVLRAISSDSSTGGTVDYYILAKITEFDA